MLAVRTTSYSLDVPIAYNGKLLVSIEYLRYVIDSANKKFQDNAKRTQKFCDSLNEKVFHYLF